MGWGREARKRYVNGGEAVAESVREW